MNSSYINHQEEIMKKENLTKTNGEEIFVQNQVRDTLFRFIYSGKDDRSRRWLLSLYNALNGTNHQNTNDLTITTIENIIYLTMKNDLSFLIDSQLQLYEHQSTINPNMPLRGLMYFAQLYQMNINKRDEDIYGDTIVKIPTPKFVVFYNGNREQEDIIKYHLSDAFEVPVEHKEFEWTATVININQNHNYKLQKSCKSLYDYSRFVDLIKSNLKTMPLKDSVINAVDYAVKNNFLEGLIEEQKMEILNTCLTEFNQEDYDRRRRREGYRKGLEEQAVKSAKNLIKLKVLTLEQIAQAEELPLEKVKELASELQN